MLKKNPKLKDITIDIRGAVTKFIADGYFTECDDGGIEYTPYFRNRNDVLAFALLVLDGVQFEDADDIYVSVMKDGELVNLYNDYTLIKKRHIDEDVIDMVEFRKQQLLHKSKLDESFESLTLLLTAAKEKLSQVDSNELEKMIKKFNVKELTKEYQEVRK